MHSVVVAQETPDRLVSRSPLSPGGVATICHVVPACAAPKGTHESLAGLVLPTARQFALVLHATPFRLDWPKTARNRHLLPFHASTALLSVGSAPP